MDPYYIHDKVQNSPAIINDVLCQRILNQAMTYQLLEHHRYFPLLNTKPRRTFGITDIIITTGGEDDKVVLRGMESFDPVLNEWKTFSCLPFALSKHGLVTSGRYLYMAGGEYPDGVTNAVLWRYEFFIDVWQELQPMALSRTELGLAYLDGYIYAIGGWDSSNRLSSLERYDPDDGTWQQMTSMPEPLSSPAVVTHRGLLYVLGGAKSKGNSCSSYFYLYDPKVDKWTMLPDMPVPKFASSAAILNDKIYVIGGYTSINGISNSVECYDISTNQWLSENAVSNMKEKRARAAVTMACDKIYIFGGEENWEKYHDTAEEYDPLTNEWKVIGNIPSARGGLTCVTIQIKREHYEKFKSIHIE